MLELFHKNISTHSLLAEGDVILVGRLTRDPISTHSLLAEGDAGSVRRFGRKDISTHSLLAEGDDRRLGKDAVADNFNPLPPRGGRPDTEAMHQAKAEFQPTPSSRRETWVCRFPCQTCSISTHSLLAEGDKFLHRRLTFVVISTHSLLAEGDVCSVRQC